VAEGLGLVNDLGRRPVDGWVIRGIQLTVFVLIIAGLMMDRVDVADSAV